MKALKCVLALAVLCIIFCSSGCKNGQPVEVKAVVDIGFKNSTDAPEPQTNIADNEETQELLDTAPVQDDQKTIKKNNDDNNQTGLYFNGLPIYYAEYGPTTGMNFVHIKSLDDYNLTLDSVVIFKGKKHGLSERILQSDNMQGGFKTTIEVIEPYYGDVDAGELVIFPEYVKTTMVNGSLCAMCGRELVPIQDDKEYFFILNNLGRSVDGTKAMGLISMIYSVYPVLEDVDGFEPKSGLEYYSGIRQQLWVKYQLERDKLDLRVDKKAEVLKLLNTRLLQLEGEQYDQLEADIAGYEDGVVDFDTVSSWLSDSTIKRLERCVKRYGEK